MIYAQEIIDRIAAFPRFPKDSRLDRIRFYLTKLGSPEKQVKFVHVAGTNGKGSTCAMIASVLQEAGYKVGLFTSPHLFDWRERIQINRKKISDAAISLHGRELLDFNVGIFEAWFLMAMKYFYAESVDIVILEAGIGGRLDATNVIPSPEVAILTNVDLEHTKLLGSTKEAIALEKSAIKKNAILLTGIEDEEILHVLPEHRAVRVSGSFQEKNKALARAAIQVLRERAWVIDDAAILSGLKKAYWPLRMEILSEKPFILADVGHNLHGIKALKASLPRKDSGVRWLWLGISKDKDYKNMASVLGEGMDKILISEADYHACPSDLLKKALPTADVMPNIKEAAAYLQSILQKEDQLFILGGLYFAAQAVQALGLD